MDDPEVPDRFKGIPSAEEAWHEGRRDGAEAGRQLAILIVSLYRLRWLLLTAVVALVAFLIFR